ncbi:MAG: hypothetical protein CM1200mP30_18470 [Pseudomonadota bacterium]|nr:MAG: hypothetical protein CM1200mP30_18470 [Pseudomonadota bacterium]
MPKKKTEMAQDELITSIRWNLPDRSDILKLYKVSKRKDLDISTFYCRDSAEAETW